MRRFEEAKALFRKMIPVARRVLGESNTITLRMRKVYAAALYLDTGATLDDLREAVETLEEAERIARRVLGGTHPLTSSIDEALRNARKVLRARETPSPPGSA
uniref:Tetratricopeptide repeat protein n=1 Tax=Pelagomonas calceolata TaxID=35677 RepID=A0A7S3ZWX6_9STRA